MTQNVEPEKPPEISMKCVNLKSQNVSQILQIAKYDAGSKTWLLDIPEICKQEETTFRLEIHVKNCVVIMSIVHFSTKSYI